MYRTVVVYLALCARIFSAEIGETKPEDNKYNHKLLVVVLDGLRWDYMENRHLKELLEYGVKAKWLRPVFPVESYPNWASLSTGVYPENHGILGNYFPHKSNQEVFFYGNESTTRQPHWWQHAEPIWVRATLNNRKAALYNMARCDVGYQGHMPSLCTGFSSDVMDSKATLLQADLHRALNNLMDDYQLAMVYSPVLADAARMQGPQSRAIDLAISQVTSVLMSFKNDLYDKKMNENVNVMVVSTYGMVSFKYHEFTYVPIDARLNHSDISRMYNYGGYCMITPDSKAAYKVYNKMKSFPGLNTYWKQDIPSYLHFKNNVNVPDILVIADREYFIRGFSGSFVEHKQIPPMPHKPAQSGMNNYAPHITDDVMGALFAWGPDFRCGVEVGGMDVVDLYELMCHLLNMAPSPNNGTWSHVAPLLQQYGVAAAISPPNYFYFVILLTLLSANLKLQM